MTHQRPRCRQRELSRRTIKREQQRRRGPTTLTTSTPHAAINADTNARNSPARRSNVNNVVDLHDDLDNNEAGADDSNYVKSHAAINALRKELLLIALPSTTYCILPCLYFWDTLPVFLGQARSSTSPALTLLLRPLQRRYLPRCL